MKTKLISAIFCVGLPIYAFIVWNSYSMFGFPDGYMTDFERFVKSLYPFHLVICAVSFILFVLAFFQKITLKKVVWFFVLTELIWFGICYIGPFFFDNGQSG